MTKKFDIYNRVTQTVIQLPYSPAPQSGDYRLVHGDCIDVMRTLPAASVDFILTDPPYIVRYQSRDGRRVLNDDNNRWLIPAVAEMHRVLKDNSYCVSFYGWHQVDRFMLAWRKAGFQPVGHFVFTKRYASKEGFTRMRHESAFLLAKGKPQKPAKPLDDVQPWNYTGNTLHPTQKPVDALGSLINAYAPPGGLILDPFAGSGSTAVAARNQGRCFL